MGHDLSALEPSNLEFLVVEKENKAANLRQNLNPVVRAVETLRKSSPLESKIIEYSGIDGLKQMNFNLTKAVNHFKVFELSDLQKHNGMNPQFVSKLRRAWTEKQIRSYDLTNNEDRAPDEADGRSALSLVAYIDPKLFRIEFETYVYNNVVSLLNYDGDDIFGVEIYNEKLAKQQEQLFDVVWRMAEVRK